MLQKLIDGEKVFLQTFCGAERSKVELFWRRFVKNNKSLSIVIVGSSPAFSNKFRNKY